MALASGTACVICAAVLVAAGLMKVKSPSLFGQQIAVYEVLPKSLSNVAGYLLPLLEIVLGGALLVMPRLGVIAALIFLSFGFAVGLNLLRGRTELRCGCFGATGRHTISRVHLVGNVLLAMLGVFAAVGTSRPTFVAIQLGISMLLLVILTASWGTMRA